jgi:hypothetical protein
MQHRPKIGGVFAGKALAGWLADDTVSKPARAVLRAYCGQGNLLPRMTSPIADTTHHVPFWMRSTARLDGFLIFTHAWHRLDGLRGNSVWRQGSTIPY